VSGWIAAVRDDVTALVRFRFVVQHLVATQLKLRYHRSVLGIGWTLLNPLLLLSVQAMAFSQILRVEAKTYTLYLFSGLILWQFFECDRFTATASSPTNASSAWFPHRSSFFH
jgi:ABC-type polysaccharide/polyol phosphate export permease